ncbi:hypothetical protein Tco_1181688 [Tanacetum coccineum]
MGYENPIRTLGDYSKPSHEGYRNTIELPVGNNVVPLRSDTIRLVQNGCSFYRLRSEDPNQHLKDFLKLVNSLDLDGENRETTRLPLAPSPNFYDHVNPVTRRTINQSAGGKLRDHNAEESWALLEDLALYDNEGWNDTRDFAKPVKAIALPQDVSSTSDRRLIQIETQYFMEDPEQAFVEYASSRTDEAGGLVSNFMASQDTRLSMFEADFKQQQSEMTNKIDTVLKVIIDRITGALPSDTVKNPKLSTTPVLSACSYPTKDPQCSTSINAITIHPKQPEESQVNEPDVGQEEKGNLGNINSNPHPKPDPLASITTEQVQKLNSMLESLGLVHRSSNAKFVCS